MELTETIVRPVSLSSPNLDPKQILKAPTTERPRKLQEFKETLKNNRDHLSDTLEGLAHEIRTWPDAPKEDLLGYFERVVVKKTLSPLQHNLIKTGLDVYQKRHKAVKDIRAEHPDDPELFAFLFGQTPQGKVEVMQGPVTLYFRCHNSKDYALIYNQAFQDNRNLDQIQIERAKRSAGVSIRYSPIPALKDSITAEYAKGFPFDERAKQIFVHEEQHAIMDLFLATFREYKTGLLNTNYKVPRFLSETSTLSTFVSPISLKLLQKDFAQANESERATILKRLLREERKRLGETKAKDEILAYTKEGEDMQSVKRTLTKPEEKEGLYDYFNIEWRRNLTDALTKILGRKFQPLIRQNIDEIFIKEYENLIFESTGIVKQFQLSGYSNEQIVNLLIDKPLSQWGKFAKRFLMTNFPNRLESDTKIAA